MLRFDPPQLRKIITTRSLWIKGKGLPKNGVQLYHEGQEIIIHTDNGHEWYIKSYYKGTKTQIKIAVIPATL